MLTKGCQQAIRIEGLNLKLPCKPSMSLPVSTARPQYQHLYTWWALVLTVDEVDRFDFDCANYAQETGQSSCMQEGLCCVASICCASFCNDASWHKTSQHHSDYGQ